MECYQRKIAAKRRKNAAQGASAGYEVGNDEAPKRRKIGRDTLRRALILDLEKMEVEKHERSTKELRWGLVEP